MNLTLVRLNGYYARLMKDIDPIKLARVDQDLQGECQLTEMQRLSEALVAKEGTASYQLSFRGDGYGKYYIDGRIQADLALECQRCGDPVIISIDTEPHLQVVLTDEQASKVANDREPLLTNGRSVSLISLIEDELLLSLPMMAKHEIGQCPKQLPDYLH